MKQVTVHKAGAGLWQRIYKQRILLAMTLPFVLWVIVFSYTPLWGLLMAFENYDPGKGILGSPWVGLKHFVAFFTDDNFILLIRNTVSMGFINIALGTVFPIVFALFLNEIRCLGLKKTVQTISYLPHFISYVVVANIFLTLLSPTDGVVNQLLMLLNITKEPVFFFAKPELFWFLIGFINIWKEVGWSAIIYIAAISSINPELYEAATTDGAGRWRKMWHITLSGIKPTIVVLLILSVPDLINAGFEPSYLLGNSLVSDYSEVIDTYVYKIGLGNGQYSFATAVGFFKMIISLILIFSANKISKKISEYGIY